ncbi:TSUP family transporter [Methylolobus aquaticus]
MELIVVCLSALIASALTLFSGFGLGTLLMPVVALFFPLELAIAMTAIVHLANNLFKIALLGRRADPAVLVRFGVPAVLTALVGAAFLTWLGDLRPWFEYSLLGHEIQVSPLKLIIGLIIIVFVALELSPWFSKLTVDRKWLPMGGMVSGFFGGLSGHQGAFRSMFLLKAGLDKEAFVATGVVLAVMVDMSRLVIYGADIVANRSVVQWPLVLAASTSAFIGAYVGSKVLKKVTIRSIQLAVSFLLTIVALGLISGAL